MKQSTNIPRTSARTRPALYLLMLVMALFSTLWVSGQTTLPDTVCLGTTKPYFVNPAPGSTYTWKLDGVLQTPTVTTDTVIISWNTLGNFELTVQELSADNCIGDVKSLWIHVKNDPPTFNVPVLFYGYCVEDIVQAQYNPAGTYVAKTDLVPPRPDYFLLAQGSTLLDYTTVVHDCPDALTISWVIDFAGATPPNLTGTGQISAAIPPEGIQFPPGNNVITWTVTDVAGVTTIYTVTLVVLPRPEIGDIPP